MLTKDYYEAALLKRPLAEGPGDPAPAKALDPSIRPEWNNFIDFVDKKGMRGNPQLDDKDKGLGKQLMAEYLKLNPQSKLSYDLVPAIQQDMQNVRNIGLKNIHDNNLKVPGVAKDDDYMANISAVDGWLGSKTSDHKFPTAIQTDNINGKTTQTNYGTNIEDYYNKLRTTNNKKQ